MLSILIPAYNFDIRQLVTDLHGQSMALKIDFEVVIYDDLSEERYHRQNRELAQLAHVSYNRLGKNLGRSRIRNVLAGAAQYENLLFMDCDSRVVKPDYIKAYLDGLDGQSVLYGGRCYTPAPPEEANLYFHWLYGKKREEQSAMLRRQNPYHAFMTNNFLMPRAVFLKIQFDEAIQTYGHEDTLFGLSLKANKVPIVHLDNPLEHIGLEDGKVFVEKNKSSLRNLKRIIIKTPEAETRLLRIFRTIKQYKLAGIVAFFTKKTEPYFLKNLNNKNARLTLFLFDLWKLGNLIALDKKQPD